MTLHILIIHVGQMFEQLYLKLSASVEVGVVVNSYRHQRAVMQLHRILHLTFIHWARLHCLKDLSWVSKV